MPNTVITTLLPAMNAGTVSTPTAATADTADLAEIFEITLDKDGKSYIEINNVSAINGTVTYSVAAGEFWMGIAALTGSVAQGVSKIIQLESAKYLKKDGKFYLTITPASGKKLKTDHALTLKAVKLA
jgi:hypothetical protein